jgi:hypothetical protein
MSSYLSSQHWDTSHRNVPTKKVIKQSSVKDREDYRCFACKEKCHNIANCPKEEAWKHVCQNRIVWFRQRILEFLAVQQSL